MKKLLIALFVLFLISIAGVYAGPVRIAIWNPFGNHLQWISTGFDVNQSQDFLIFGGGKNTTLNTQNWSEINVSHTYFNVTGNTSSIGFPSSGIAIMGNESMIYSSLNQVSDYNVTGLSTMNVTTRGAFGTVTSNHSNGSIINYVKFLVGVATNQAPYLAILSTNRTGINTILPNASLHVIGDMIVSGNMSALRYFGDGSTLTGIVTSAAERALQPHFSNNTLAINWTGVANVGLFQPLWANNSLAMNWTGNAQYPVPCPAGSALTALNDSVTCTAFGTGDANVTDIPSSKNLQPKFGPRRWRFAAAQGIDGAVLIGVGMRNPNGTGISSSDTNFDSTQFTSYQCESNFTAPVHNASCGVFGGFEETKWKYNPFIDTKIVSDNTTCNQLVWVGLSNETFNITAGTGAGISQENGTGLGIGANYAAFRYRCEISANFNDSNWKTCWGNGTLGVCFNTTIAMNPKVQYNFSVNITNSTFVQYFSNGVPIANITVNRSVVINNSLGPINLRRSLNSSAGATHKISTIYVESN